MNHFIVANAQQCLGCHGCEVACVMAHNDGHHVLSPELFKPRIHVVKREGLRMAMTCRHCEGAPCMQSCPTGAISLEGDHIGVDGSLCIGCKSCEMSCPFGMIEVVSTPRGDNSFASQAIKCDLCSDRSGGPACVEQCPANALSLVDEARLAQLESQRRERAAMQSIRPVYISSDQHSQPVLDFSKIKQLRQTAPREDAKKIPIEQRKQGFDELYITFKPEQVASQTERCLKCGEHSICEWNCPLHNHIPQWIELAKEGRFLEAVELSHQTNCMPEITGRICPQDRLCEGSCTLRDDSGAVTIGNIERYISERALAQEWRPDLSAVNDAHRRVAVIGAGPAGLACADVLARNGVKATVFDRNPEIGGLLTFGIPAFKLDKSLLARRRSIFSQMGIEFHLNCEISKDIQLSELLSDYDAVFVGVGTYRSMKLGLPHDDAQGVYDALPYLAANTRNLMHLPENTSEPYLNMAGQRVIVLGGGDTAMDCVRTAIRQGAAQVTCAYRRDESNMPGSKKEVNNAREEGAEFEFNVQPVSIELDADGTVCGMNMLRTRLGEPDSSGRRRPEPIKGSEFLLAADAVIIAFGFQPHDLPWLTESGVAVDDRGRIIASVKSDLAYQTSNPKIFAGGDAVRGADLVVTAMAEGRHAADGIMRYLQVS